MTSTSDEYDEHDEILDLAHNLPTAASSSTTDLPPGEKLIRKRSSKACDNCRKAKCKCERSSASAANGDPCRNCVLLGAECTFLGPSRKRGPPKGYIDALESKLHQMEALLGTIITSTDSRARSLVQDLSQDQLAREIIQRVDESPFGTRGRKQAAASRELYGRGVGHSRRSRSSAAAAEEGPRFGFMGPPHDWQDSLSDLISHSASASSSKENSKSPSYTFDPVNPHQRRRIERSPTPPLNLITARGLGNQVHPQSASRNATLAEEGDDADDSDSSDLADAVGQLSVNELKQVRYHGKASGLHLLMPAMGEERRARAGIWEFPPAGVWPPAVVKMEEGVSAPRGLGGSDEQMDLMAATALPPLPTQEHLIRLYFTYVHPILPIVQKRQFLLDFSARNDPSHPAYSEAVSRIPNLLLLAMFSVASRYSHETPLPDEGNMWTAGDIFFDKARELVVSISSLSRPDTVQTLILMGYREIGLGTMAQAWLYIGVAIRVAQDMGMHRSIAKWRFEGQARFTPEEKEVRSRIWHACVRMDKYVSMYIGRPLTVYEHDYDTPLPEEDEEEENEIWHEHPSVPAGAGFQHFSAMKVTPDAKPSRVISCFRASTTLSVILGSIVFNLYAIRGPPSAVRHRERANIESKLEKWMLDLPEHLRFGKVMSPHVLTLHMQYWCTVLLLNRPFIRASKKRPSSPSALDPEEADKLFNTCQTAAHHITSIATAYADGFCMRRAPALFSYYIFTASIMHVTSLMRNGNDVQASVGLQKTMEVLKRMSVVWPSAARAWDLLNDVKIDVKRAEVERLTHAPERKKRVAADTEQSYVQGPSSRKLWASSEMLPPLSVDPIPSRTQSFSAENYGHVGMGYEQQQQPNFHSPVPSYDRWASQNPSPVYPHAPQAQMTHPIAPLQQTRQGSTSTDQQYPFSASPVDLPSYLAPGRPSSQQSSSQQSQASFHEPFTPSPVPNQPAPQHSGFWNDYQVADPFGDPSLLSSYANPLQPPGLEQANGGMHQPPPPEQAPMSGSFTSLNSYFAGGPGSSSAYFGVPTFFVGNHVPRTSG